MPDIDEMTLEQIGAEIADRGFVLTVTKIPLFQRWVWWIGFRKGDGAHATKLDAARSALRWLRKEEGKDE